jgi:predicted nucleic acid-binding protein
MQNWRVITLVVKNIRFINVQLISKEAYKIAAGLTKDVDIDDTEFVALTEHLKGRLWSGDKELQKGLQKKGWSKFISTDELLRAN